MTTVLNNPYVNSFGHSVGDFALGMTIAQVVDGFFPGITQQGPIQLAIESLLQVGITSVIGYSLFDVIRANVEDDPTHGGLFVSSLFYGMTKAKTKALLLGRYVHIMARQRDTSSDSSTPSQEEQSTD